jgi:hypothetical protein
MGAFIAPVVRFGNEEMQLPTSTDKPVALIMLCVPASSSEGMRKLAGNGASSLPDASCGNP